VKRASQPHSTTSSPHSSVNPYPANVENMVSS